MKGYLLLILLICTTLQAQTKFSQASGNQQYYFNLWKKNYFKDCTL